MNMRITAKPLSGVAVRPQARAQRMHQIMRSVPKQGTYGGSSQPMGEEKQAKTNEQGAAPEGDKALEGEKVQLAGASAPGPTDYDMDGGSSKSDKTTPAGESDEKKAGH